MPKLQDSGLVRLRSIPSTNKAKFVTTLVPVYEAGKVNIDELSNLVCRSGHEVKPLGCSYKENDILYEIFSEGPGLNTDLMCTWLHFFMIEVHGKYFLRFASKYLTSKGLTLIDWAGSITSGLKGDILALFALCLLVGKHCLLHLRDGKVWTTVQVPPSNHDELLQMCNYHLVFMGCGIFIELKPCV